MNRKYEQKERARRKEQTRERIVEAAVELHTSVGPARTTISGIADRAGVEGTRSTPTSPTSARSTAPARRTGQPRIRSPTSSL